MTTAAQEALAGLRKAVATPPEPNDLGLLARMHSWCQNLVEETSSTGGDPGQKTRGELAQGLVTLLEQLILDEAADSATGIKLVPEAVGLLDQAHQGQAIDAAGMLVRIGQAVEGPAGGSAPPPPAVAPASQPARAPRTPAPPTVESPGAAAPGPNEPYVSEPLVIDLNECEHLEGFLEEAAEHMDSIETGVLEVETEPTDTARINELFRPFHTIKGVAGFLNLRDINRVTHELETILDLGRKGELRITPAIIDLILRGVDVLQSQLAEIRQYLAAPTDAPCPQPDVVGLMAELRRAARPDGAAAAADEPRPRLGEILVAEGAATEPQVDAALDAQAEDTQDPPRKVGQILVDRGVITAKQIDQALVRQTAGKALADASIRVDTTKLDALVDAVGELVIAQSMVSMADAISHDEKLGRNVSQVTKIVRDVQETAMAMRMVPIGHTFQKMRRLVRDLSRKAGKTVNLTINGEDTELDKNVIQEISDPLVHMVRNAIDHGIGSPEARRQAGKPEEGQVWLDAYHQGDSIVIGVRDDGQGLDYDKLVAKGIERGLIAPGDQPSEQQAFALIMQPGFSTAEQVTDVSGRGVGMDVVRRNIEKLRGKIEISSEKGRGSTFHIRLPLTLAIIDGMLIRVADERFIIPTILIEQSLQPEPKQITSVQHRGAMLQVRGELCPLIQVGALFEYGPPIDPCEHLVVIVQSEGRKIGLVVDELIGQQQVVIKTLGERFKQVKGVSGAAILGDGRVGVILETSGLLAWYNEHGCGAFSAREDASIRAAAVDSSASATGRDGSADPAVPEIPETPRESGVTCPVEPALTSL